jgi:hypothetical protein
MCDFYNFGGDCLNDCSLQLPKAPATSAPNSDATTQDIATTTAESETESTDVETVEEVSAVFQQLVSDFGNTMETEVYDELVAGLKNIQGENVGTVEDVQSIFDDLISDMSKSDMMPMMQ